MPRIESSPVVATFQLKSAKGFHLVTAKIQLANNVRFKEKHYKGTKVFQLSSNLFTFVFYLL